MSGLTLEIFRDGKKEGKAEGITSTIFSLAKEGLLTISVAAKKLNMKEEEVKKILENNRGACP